jgi:small subunit ribosomal protein S17
MTESTQKQENRGVRRSRTGRVVSDAMDKTVVVMSERLVKHPLYKKFIRRRKKVVAHDEKNECKVGDIVRVVESRPLSKTKFWRVAEIMQHGTQITVGEIAPEQELSE